MFGVYESILAGVMIVTGSINTLSTAWADNITAVGLEGEEAHKFNHPFLQACGMFLGETLCFLGYLGTMIFTRYKRRTGAEYDRTEDSPPVKFNPLIFLPPAVCDMIGTSLMYVGLTLTFASSFQMLRGAVIIFTGLLSVAFLGRSLRCYQWTGMFIVIVGLFTVGCADIVSGNVASHDINGVIAGDLLIVAAQIIVATQMVIEEKYVVKHNVPPLLAVGFEGLFGFVILSILLVPMYFIILPARYAKNPEHRLEDAIDGLMQLGNNWQISLAIFGNVISIAFFNFAGISVTKEMSATTRMVLDSVRTLVIWVVSLALSWQQFHYLQVIGFAALVTGMCLYYDIIILPFIRARGFMLSTGPRQTPPAEGPKTDEGPSA